MKKKIYMDHAATTELAPEARAAMAPYLAEAYGNASTWYELGKEARRALEEARQTVAKIIDADPEEIYFTSGGSESDNWAIKAIAGERRQRSGQANNSVAEGRRQGDKVNNSSFEDRRRSDQANHFAVENSRRGGQIITSSIEHHAILNSCAYLEQLGYQVVYLPVDRRGVIDQMALRHSIGPQTALISIMYGNNEIGTIEPVEEIGQLAHQYQIPFHTDAVQVVGQLPLSMKNSTIDLLSASAHKFHGPKGVGFLYVNREIAIPSFIHGGGQEKGKRAGTENVAGVVGMAAALRVAAQNQKAGISHITNLREELVRRVMREIPDTLYNGHPIDRLPGNISFSFRGVNATALLVLLEEAGIYASAGSACTTGSMQISHVIQAIHVPQDYAEGTVRLTLGSENTLAEVRYCARILAESVKLLRMV